MLLRHRDVGIGPVGGGRVEVGEDAEEAGMDGFHGAMVYLGDALGRAEADHIVEQFDISRRQTVAIRSSSADEAP